jgi:hypothetical protein
MTPVTTKKALKEPAFLICVVVLAAAGAGSRIAAARLGLFLQKEPIPLRKCLDMLDEKPLTPYIIESQNKSRIQDSQTVESLGTEQYILWQLEDAQAESDSPTRRCALFITYYGSPNKVPHVPEECYAGSGYERIASDSLTLNIDDNNGFSRKIPARYLVFSDKNAAPGYDEGTFPVLYFFRVNNQYAGSREQVRIALNKNVFNKFSYFSKVELAFNCSKKAPTQQQTVEAAQKLMSVILPVLEGQHWPNREN